jgi:CheY-like chemotaxis protein
MQEAQKLESLGVLAGGIAHDFNNLLTAVLGHAALAQQELPEGAPLRDTLFQIERAAQRAAELCNQMLAYSGRARLELEPVDVSVLVEEMAGLLRASIAKSVNLSLALDGDLPTVEGDPTQLRQVVMNLITNASEAMPEEGGEITVRTASSRAERSLLVDVDWSDELPPGDYVLLEVADTGCGMDEATRRRLFEPFFTTKFTGRGLGMAAVRGIVRGHRGAIHVASAPGRGSHFRVLLPAQQGRRALAPRPAAAAPAVLGGTVLVVDDEPSVRRVVTRMLEHAGYRALAARSGREGLALLEAQRGEIAALVLDLTMPDLRGEEVLASLREREPALPVVLMSGYARQELESLSAGTTRLGLLHKPFREAELLAALAAAAGGDRPGSAARTGSDDARGEGEADHDE